MFGFIKTLRARAAGVIAGLALGLAASGASALTVNFDQYITGTNLGQTTLATLTATQNGNNVDMVFTNTGIVGGTGTFDTALQMMYNGSTSGISLLWTGGVQVSNFTLGGGIGPFNPWDLVVNWATSNSNGGANRLNVGEFSSFTLVGAQLSNLFFGSGSNPSAMIHVQGLTGGGSTKYGPSPVPVPAAGFLLFGALGGLGLAARRRRAA
ncbi:VPLPA-CTERM sorting domain-containing protein [Frigidibacter sp. RF13]|uniref:VPLPA-CTERM sorting domain-containing protein n=1 Tax=Frigidibacter sp. RF13 TaxID=2997340 RepID=UPI002271C1AD|nr:VPLPA-CTERM sorting domain-containing protein [Frigidibacter sp. RF13]MCY1127895.1 VPLPA-CTERM sorting domain-containing protein [Frigidibacter sp. RF13]